MNLSFVVDDAISNSSISRIALDIVRIHQHGTKRQELGTSVLVRHVSNIR